MELEVSVGWEFIEVNCKHGDGSEEQRGDTCSLPSIKTREPLSDSSVQHTRPMAWCFHVRKSESAQLLAVDA